MTASANKNSKIMKIGGICAILSGLVYVISFSLNIFSISPKVTRIEDIGLKIEAYNNVQQTLTIYSAIGLLATILLIPATLGFYHLLRNVEPRSQIAVAAMYCGILFLVVSFITSVILAIDTVPNYVTADTTGRLTIIEDYRTIDRIIDISWMVGITLTLGVSTGLFAFFSLRESKISKRIGRIGVIGGILSLFWLSYLTPQIFLAIAMVLGAFLSLVWVITMGIMMIKQ